MIAYEVIDGIVYPVRYCDFCGNECEKDKWDMVLGKIMCEDCMELNDAMEKLSEVKNAL